MSSRVTTILLVLALVLPAAAQQTGDANRDYTINGIGAGGTSFVSSTVGVPSTLSNVYQTMDAGAPVVWAAAPNGNIGWYTTPTNSVDIGPNLTLIADGTDTAHPLSPFAMTDATGRWQLGVTASGALAGQTLYLACAHGSQGSPDNFYVSQTHRVSFSLDPNLQPGNPTCSSGAVPLTLSDDSFSQQTLGFTFNFFGVGYTQVFVGSNGHCTFGTGNNGWASGGGGLNSTYPTIALCSEDFNPGAGGQVMFLTDNVGVFEVCYVNVPSFGTANQNTLRLVATNGSTITFDYAATMGEDEGTVGLSAGNNLNTPYPLNLSIVGGTGGPTLIPPGTTPFEDFTTGTNPLDLRGYRLNWVLDGTGTPIFVL